MLKKIALLAAAVSALGLSAAANAAPIVYVGSQQVGSFLANYSITTDGALGDIGASHVSAFDVTLSDSLSSISYGRTTAGGTGSDAGNLFATATSLTIPLFLSLSLYTNASSPAGGTLGFLEFRYNETYAQMDDAAHGAGLVQIAPEQNSTVPFASVAPTSAVPEPATWGMMILGMGMVGAGIRYRRKSTKVSFA